MRESVDAGTSTPSAPGNEGRDAALRALSAALELDIEDLALLDRALTHASTFSDTHAADSRL